MLSFLVSAYRANPVRPHCNSRRHTVLCRIATMILPVTCDMPGPGKSNPLF